MPRINIDTRDSGDSERGPFVAKPTPEAGQYRFVVVKTDYQPNKKQNGSWLMVRYHCLDSRYPGYEFSEYLNVVHPNGRAQGMARAALRALATAVGYERPEFVQDSEDLHGIPLVLTLEKEQCGAGEFGADSEGFRPKIVGYDPDTSGRKGPDVPPTSEGPALLFDSPSSDDEIPF